MKKSVSIFKKTSLALIVLLTVPAIAWSTEKLPPEKAGVIGKPEGKIAFIRDANVWAMEASGANQYMICESANADGRLSWSPDGKKIAFTRSGRITTQLPDYTGGVHKVYDVFLAYMDSAYANNYLFWYRLTTDLGSRDPEWSADGKTIIIWRDMNANKVDAAQPNYQICTMDSIGDNVELIRKDWQGQEEFLATPSINAAGTIACVSIFEQKQQGLLVLSKAEYMIPMDSAKALARQNHNCVAPSWSPDGKWLAYVNINLEDGSLYIITPDLKERYNVFIPPPGLYLNTVSPSFSPDSKWLTFSTTDGSIWICDITGNGARRLSGPGTDKFPTWSKTP